MTTLFLVSLLLIVYTFILYPLAIGGLALFLPKRKRPALPDPPPSVSLLIVVRNGEKMIENKIKNSLQLDYPTRLLEIVVVSDGSTDGTASVGAAWSGRGIRFYDFPEGGGKISAINRAATLCRNEILVFSDVDALLEQDALKKLVSWFADYSIGGVCGRKIVRRTSDSFSTGQRSYLSYEDFVRNGEGIVSSIASNEGKLYAMRRSLFAPIPLGVMDDIMNAMHVIAEGRRFIFDAEAKAYIPAPSADPLHEIQRRRRIVNPSLLGMTIMRSLFNPFRYGLYSFILFSHKVLRRVAPFFMAALIVGTAGICLRHPLLAALLGLEALVCANALARHFGFAPTMKAFPRAEKLSWAAYYFCLGNWGTLLGVLDFLRGRHVTQWQPRKGPILQDEKAASTSGAGIFQ